ncbi:MAG: hypothetical protein ACRDT4_05210 [Micromonosporaceae bacterium]
MNRVRIIAGILLAGTAALNFTSGHHLIALLNAGIAVALLATTRASRSR